MAYDEFLADRIRNVFHEKNVTTEEKKMMGGLGFMVDDKLCIGIYKEELMARVDPEEVPELLKINGARQMIHGSRPMKGYLNISAEGFDMDIDLEFWIRKCLEFNPRAKSSKKKKR
ncbi:MAG: TfoX/Sxy family protein [Saprospiraceae bacterium]|nr:TfoX/Sxy family protein [Bacteroidia bacterium]NNF22468.1 TfoX/Sxy family protein [Saprospiraceae bacterium]